MCKLTKLKENDVQIINTTEIKPMDELVILRLYFVRHTTIIHIVDKIQERPKVDIQ